MAAKKTQTLKEFQAWLEGIEELQAKGWSPDKSQWTKIRNRIRNIVEEAPPAPAAPPRQMPMPPAPQPMVPAPAGPIQPAAMQPAPLMQAPTDVEMSPAAAQLLKTGKLPDIDASAGDAPSLFE